MTIEIKLSVLEAFDKGIWDDLCRLRGWSVWAVNEGQISSSEIITLTADEAEQLGLSVKSLREYQE